jgi:HSP20 family protein
MRALIPWRRATTLMEPLQTEMEELFERFFEPFELKENGKAAMWAPRVNVEETEKEFIVTAELPGLEAKEVEVTMEEGALILKGEKKEEKEEKKKNFHRVERFVGRFYRAIPLPAGVEAEKITAVNAKGVLTVAVPKKPEVVPKKILITEEK